MEVLATFHILKMPPSWSRRDMILFLLWEEMIQISYTTFSLHLALYDWEFVQTLDYEALEMYQPLGFPQQTMVQHQSRAPLPFKEVKGVHAPVSGLGVHPCPSLQDTHLEKKIDD